MFFIIYIIIIYKFHFFGNLIDFICKLWQNLGIIDDYVHGLTGENVSNLTKKTTIRSLDKKKVFLSQIALLAVVFLFLADRSMVFSWIKNFTNMTQSAELERIVSQLLVPSKTIYELSQAISVFYILKMLVVVTVATMLLLFFFQFVVSYTTTDRKVLAVKTPEVAENNQFTYKEQEKFLC